MNSDGPVLYNVLRVEKLTSLASITGSLAHTYRTTEGGVEGADPARAADNTHHLANEAEVLRAIEARMPERRRKDAVLGLEYLISGTHKWFVDKRMSEQDSYFSDALEWLKTLHGLENVVSWSIHRDEFTPHLVAYIVPRIGDRLSAKTFTGGPLRLVKMQTDFAVEVSRKHGLERGIEGSNATHTSVRAYRNRILAAGKIVVLKVATEVPDKPGVWASKASKDEYESKLKKRAAEERARENSFQLVAAMAQEAEPLRAEVAELKRANSRLFKQNQVLKAKAELLDLFTVEQVEAARQAHALKQILAAVKAAQRAEVASRVGKLPRLAKVGAGAEGIFAKAAVEALEKAGGKARDVRWGILETAAALSAIEDGGQDPEMVLQELLRVSPARANPATHEELALVIRRDGPVAQRTWVARRHLLSRPGIG